MVFSNKLERVMLTCSFIDLLTQQLFKKVCGKFRSSAMGDGEGPNWKFLWALVAIYSRFL